MDFLKQQFTGGSSSSSDLEDARTAFDAVAEIFPKGQREHLSLPWALGVSSTRSCLAIMRLQGGDMMAEEFVDSYLFKIVHLLLQQQPSKLGPTEKESIERTVKQALHIFMKLTPQQMSRNANILSDIFGRQHDLYFYSGNKTSNWTSHEGHTRVRSDMIKEFAKSKGFQRLFGAVLNEATWHGATSMVNFLDAAREAYRESHIDKTMLVNILHEVSASLLRAKDEDVKNDDSMTVADLIKRIQAGYRMAGEPVVEFHKFWLQHTLKLMGSSYIMLRLFAWDQVAAIIEAAEWNKPLAQRYIVEGAGCMAINGTYEFLRRQEDKDKHWSIIYHKGADEKEGVPALTLIRCKMKDDCKKWFFSEVDLNNPGTNADVDYYNQYKAVPAHQKYLEREPPTQPYLWEVSKNGKNVAPCGAPPGPTLRKDGVYLPAGEQSDTLLINLIPQWFRSGKVLRSIFGDNVSREVVARSKQLLQHVATSEALTTEDLEVIWMAALREGDVIIAENIFDLLAELSPKLAPALFDSLMSTATQRLQSDSEADFEKVVLFVEKYCKSGFQLVDTLRDESVKSFIALVWALYQDTRFETIKGRQAIETLLSTCLGTPGGASVTLDQVQECVDSLQTAKQQSSASADSEAACSRVVHTLQFLISKHTKPSTVVKLHESDVLPRAVVDEVRRFVETNRGKASMRKGATSGDDGSSSSSNSSSSNDSSGSSKGTEEPSAYALGVRDRLQVLVQFYSHASGVKLPLADTKTLYSLLCKDREELAELHRLLLHGVASTSTDAIFSLEVAGSVFADYFCSPDMQWGRCDATALECFQAYYTRLEEHQTLSQPQQQQGDDEPDTEPSEPEDEESSSSSSLSREHFVQSGVATLWRMALALPSGGNTPSRAMELLLKVYEPEEAETETETETEAENDHGLGGVYPGDPPTATAIGPVSSMPVSVPGSLVTDVPSSSSSSAIGRVRGRARGTASGEIVEGLFDTAFAHLQNALVEARAQNGALKASCELVVLRVLSLLSMAITRSQSPSVRKQELMHATKGIMQNMRVKVRARKVITYKNHSTNTSVSRLEKGSEATLVINTHPMHSLKSLRIAIASAGRYASPSKLTFDDDNLQDAADRTLVGELGVKEGSDISVFYSSSPGYPQAHGGQSYGNVRSNNAFPFSSHDDPDTPEDPANMFPLVEDVAAALSNNDARFSCLLELCDHVRSDEVLSKLWWLIGMVPTQAQLSHAFDGLLQTAAEGGNVPAHGWKQFLYSGGTGNTGAASSGARALYALQTLDHILQPNKELHKPVNLLASIGVGDEQEEDVVNVRARTLKDVFVRSGGFTSLLDIVLTSGTPSDTTVDEASFVRRTTLCTALHVMHFLLLGALDVDVDVMTLEHAAVLKSVPDTPHVDDLDEADIRVFSDAMELHIAAQANRSENGHAPTTSVISSSSSSAAVDASLMSQLESGASAMVRKLIVLAVTASGNGSGDAAFDSDFVQLKTCLDILTLLLRFKGASVEVVSNDIAKKLVVLSLRSDSELTRKLCSRFAICVGQSQSNIFKWLVTEIKCIQAGDSTCGELFEAIGALLADGSSTSSEANDVISLAQFVAQKLSTFRGSSSGTTELLGFLKLLEVLVKYHLSALSQASPDGAGIEKLLIDDFLFTVSPSMLGGRASGPSDAGRPLCDTPALRTKAFDVLLAFAKAAEQAHTSAGVDGETNSDAIGGAVVKHLGSLLESAASVGNSGTSWALLASDFNSLRIGSEVAFSGLKNQGCTCYANSLLQQLFMCKEFRQAVMEASMVEHHRTSFWHLSNAALVGRTLEIEYRGDWSTYRAEAYDERTSQITLCPTSQKSPSFTFGKIQQYREEGRVRLCAADDVEEGKALTKEDKDAFAILDQVQRTFAYLEFSKRTYYDPRPLIEACKPLNMEFSVFHQNDACEFFDKLMEKMETAMQGKHTGFNVWRDVVRKKVFGGSTAYDKIPQGCDHYSMGDKTFLHNLIAVVRGHSSLKNALNSEFTGEMMRGDNGIDCEMCGCKRDTTRRHSIIDLPNHLVVHLRRFDLDFTTFETVKINSRFEFPMTFDMFPWTKKGQDQEQEREVKRRQQQQQQQQQPPADGEGEGDTVGDADGKPGDDDVSASVNGAEEAQTRAQDDGDAAAEEEEERDPLDTSFVLSGVLSHSGVANGGHYYSFCRSPEDGEEEDKWYRLDDDDVTPFDPADIPYQCYGGPGGDGDTHDKSSNGLILFYNKVRPQVGSEEEEEEEEEEKEKEKESSKEDGDKEQRVEGDAASVDDDLPKKRGRLVNGYEAYEPEIGQSNLLHTLHSYLLDTDLHSFLLRLSRAPAGGTGTGASITFMKFLCDVILHSRDLVARAGTRWVQAANTVMVANPATAAWFAGSVLIDDKQSTWFNHFFNRCPDPKIKQAFRATLVAAVAAVVRALEPLASSKSEGNEAGTEAEETAAMITEEVRRLDTSEEVMAELTQRLKHTLIDNPEDKGQDCEIYLALLALITHRLVALLRANVAEDIILLIRDLCSSEPLMRKVLLSHSIVMHLSWFADPSSRKLPQGVKDLYTSSAWAKAQVQHQQQQQQQHHHVQGNSNSIAWGAASTIAFEALAVVAGASYCARVSLLSDKVSTTNWEQQLTHSCRVAFTTIFEQLEAERRERERELAALVDNDPPLAQTNDESANEAPYLDHTALQSYLTRIGEAYTQPQGILDKYRAHVSTITGGLNLLGFLQFCCDRGNASNTGETTLWEDLRAYHFMNDLTRNMNAVAAAAKGEAESRRQMQDDAIVSEPVTPPSPSPGVSSPPSVTSIGRGFAGVSVADGDADSDTSVNAIVEGIEDAGYGIANGDSDGEVVPALVAESRVPGNPTVGPDRLGQRSAHDNMASEISARATTMAGAGLTPRGSDIFDNDFALGNGAGEFQISKPQKLVVSDLCRSILSDPGMYARGMETNPAATGGLIRCACFEEQELSLQLIEDALAKLVHYTRQGSKTAAAAVTTLLTSLLSLDDSLVQARTQTLLMEPTNGLVAVIMTEIRNPSPVHVSQWNPLYSVKNSYLEYLTHFLRHAPTHDLIQSLSESDPAVKRVRRQLRSDNSEFSEEERDLIEKCSLVVSECGYPQIDGEYHFHRVLHGAGMYIKHGTFTSAEGAVEENAKFCIYKCPVRTKSMQWFLSIVPADIDPGSAKDVDYFYQHDDEHKPVFGRLLPPPAWHVYERRGSPGLEGAGRTAATASSLPATRLELVFHWENSELQTIGEELLEAATQAEQQLQQQQPTSYSTDAGAYHGGGSPYRRGYDNQMATWDDDSIYDESKNYDGSAFIYRE